MNINDFKEYWDGNNLLSPQPGMWIPGQRGSDNGVCFTSEYMVMLKKSGLLTPEAIQKFLDAINACLDSDGLLNRAPGDPDLADPDDHYSLLNALIEIKETSIARGFFKNVFKFFGSFNNTNPGTWTIQSVLVRQPQLFCAIVNSAFPSLLNPLHWLVRFIFNPYYIISALIIATSCIGVDPGDTDSRRLAWSLQNNLKKTSLICWLASKIWMWRLNKDYTNKMQSVAAIYYQPQGLGNNPYSKWWITD